MFSLFRFAFSARGQFSLYHLPYSFFQAGNGKIGKDNRLLHLPQKAHSNAAIG
jgi:hypothetical protein